MVRLALGRGIQDAVEEVDFGVVENDAAQLGQQGGGAATEGGGRAQVHQGQEKGLQVIVQLLQEGKAQAHALWRLVCKHTITAGTGFHALANVTYHHSFAGGGNQSDLQACFWETLQTLLCVHACACVCVCVCVYVHA